MGLSKFLPYAAGALVGVQALLSVLPAPEDAIRPPGAGDEKLFLSTCIKCGRCIQACPYVALFPSHQSSGFGLGAPTFDLRTQACRLCDDFPCSTACPTGALKPVESPAEVRMGTAVINEDLCIALQGMRCEVCYRVCPLIDSAITIDYRLREGDATHSIFAPLIHIDECVGCGLCVQRCVIDEPEVAIKIVRTIPDG